MTTLTVKVEEKKQAQMLYQMLRAMSFVKEVEIEDELSEQELSILNERLVEYEKSPKSGKSLDSVVKAISKKHGFKYRP